MPSLSVLLPVRNAGRWLEPSLASLWRQSHGDFEVVAVDDGSTDGSGERLERAAAREPRLRLVRGEARGLPAALNTALEHARAPLLARHDADDLSHRRRFELQTRYLARHPEVGVVGSRVHLFPAQRCGRGMRRWEVWHNLVLTHDQMSHEALIDSPVAHGTTLARRETVEAVGGWSERGWPEDLDLWLRLLDAGTRFAKLPHRLYAWRQHPGSATRREPRYRRERFIALKRDALARGFLRGCSDYRLVGVGQSLALWCEALDPLPARLHPQPVGRPTPETLEALIPPLVLVFGSLRARERWREALTARGLAESRDFIFVA